MTNTPAQRVIFHGVTGSGKSSAAHAYAPAAGLPEYSADDDIGWLPGWQQRPVEERRIGADLPPVIRFRRPRWIAEITSCP